MGQVATTIRLDSELKEKFDSLCEEFGMNVNTAFCIFAKAVVRSRSIPFKIEAEAEDVTPAVSGRNAFYALRNQAQNAGGELSLEEINAEISEYREERQR